MQYLEGCTGVPTGHYSSLINMICFFYMNVTGDVPNLIYAKFVEFKLGIDPVVIDIYGANNNFENHQCFCQSNKNDGF
jgi:hypothetical protein